MKINTRAAGLCVFERDFKIVFSNVSSAIKLTACPGKMVKLSVQSQNLTEVLQAQ